MPYLVDYTFLDQKKKVFFSKTVQKKMFAILMNNTPPFLFFSLVRCSVVQAEKQHQSFMSGIEQFHKEELKHTDPNIKSVMPDTSGKFDY